MYCKGSTIHTAAGFEPHARTTMPSKPTWQFELLQHELILTYFSEEQNQFTQSRECRKLGFGGHVHTILPDDYHRFHKQRRSKPRCPISDHRKTFREQEKAPAASTLHCAQRNHGRHHHPWPFQNLCKAPCPSGPTSTPSWLLALV